METFYETLEADDFPGSASAAPPPPPSIGSQRHPPQTVYLLSRLFYLSAGGLPTRACPVLVKRAAYV